MEPALRPETARVDLSRLRRNFEAVAAYGGRPVMPVVKADAYGHGPRAALAFEALGAPLLGVAFVEEGASLRKAGAQGAILVLAGAGPEEAEALVAHRLATVVATPRSQRGALEAARLAPGKVAIHLKVDTGMTRLGLAPDEAAPAARRLASAGCKVEGLLTHLASAAEAPETTDRQLDAFDAVVADLARQGIRPPWVHAANSAGLLHLRPTHTLVRPGLLLYGLRPRPRTPEVEVHPVMTLAGRIELLREVPAGTAVSYGGRWIARRPSRIATATLGYADGVPRTEAMARRGQLSIRGRRAAVAGTVCMDFTMLDVTERPDVQEGDEAVVFGDDPTAWDVADWAGTNAWEVLTSVGLRVPRVYVDDGREVEVLSRY
ncbi:MAG TPA: alanine racemase [Vicinamibacteria bacterium]|nr:alanine racemase [Vicinamibacteria bacterium]